MKHKLLFALFFTALFVISDSVSAQKYWVMFKNKTGTPYSVSTPSAYLGPKAIARRATQSIAIDNTDLPVTPSYVSQIDAVTDVNVLYRSKWLNGIVIAITNTASVSSALAAINSFTFVQSTGQVNRYKITYPLAGPAVPGTNASGDRTHSTTGFNYGGAVGQNTMVGVDCLHNAGYRGQGITIAVMDEGFNDVQLDDIFDSLFIQKRLLGTRDFITGDTMVFEDGTHGANVLSTMAGCKPGTMIGSAPKANYWLLRTEDGNSETISEEYNWVRGAEFADSVGADITTTSLGYTTFDLGQNNHTYATLNGKTAPMSIAATMASRKGMIVLNAAGNEGQGSWYYIAVPADADSIITVGSVGVNRVYSGFSSHGPTADGRIKPDLCAQGGPGYVCYHGCGIGYGTSYATPVLAGSVACLLQLKKFATPMQIISALKATADSAANPNNRIGWGVANVCAAASHSFLSVPSLNKEDNSVKIYPNPFTNELVIMMNNLPAGKTMVSITNLLGQELYSEELKDSNATAIYLNDLKNYKAGLYFVNIRSAELNISRKVVKQ